MNALQYIQDAGKQFPTFSSEVLSTTKAFFDPKVEEDCKNNLAKHAENIHAYFNKHVYAH